MQTAKQSPKDPATGSWLSLLLPGLGHLYAGNAGSFAVFLAAEIWLFSNGWISALVVLHVFQAVAAGGAVKQWNQKHGFTQDVVVPPPPPARGSRGSSMAPPTIPTPKAQTAEQPSPPALFLDAESFLAELQDAWREHRTGGVGSRQFADRKWRAIRAVGFASREDGEALVEAAKGLAAAGVLTTEEVGQLAAKVSAT